MVLLVLTFPVEKKLRFVSAELTRGIEQTLRVVSATKNLKFFSILFLKKIHLLSTTMYLHLEFQRFEADLWSSDFDLQQYLNMILACKYKSLCWKNM